MWEERPYTPRRIGKREDLTHGVWDARIHIAEEVRVEVGPGLCCIGYVGELLCRGNLRAGGAELSGGPAVAAGAAEQVDYRTDWRDGCGWGEPHLGVAAAGVEFGG